jgi:hypothetical protein
VGKPQRPGAQADQGRWEAGVLSEELVHPLAGHAEDLGGFGR